MSEKKKKINRRHQARRYTIQVLYQWHINGGSIAQNFEEFVTEHPPKNVDQNYFKELLLATVENVQETDGLMSQHLDRKVEELDPIELAVLRLSVYELKHRMDVPYRVVINEALELAKVFGAQDSYKYVNGVLDSLAPKLREFEVAARKK